MKGIVLAGGQGTRLHPVTRVLCKQLLPVYDKPMIYYPLTTLMLAGLRDVLVISTPEDTPRFEALLGDGDRWGMRLRYAVQDAPRGLADAFRVGAEFLDGDGCTMVLGDNLFFGADLSALLCEALAANTGATIFASQVRDPERFGVIEFDAADNPVAIVEKPAVAPSRYAVTGLYVYDGNVTRYAADLRPSARGELEISELNQRYLDERALTVCRLPRGMAWLDAGTHDSLLEAAQFVQTIEHRQAIKIACPEEISWRAGWIDDDRLRGLADAYPKGAYGDYLRALLHETPSGEGDRAS
ncbi:MAG: glucose-1-phosphate thymidylyltransferase RfbA [Pseudomonadota bacterium]